MKVKRKFGRKTLAGGVVGSLLAGYAVMGLTAANALDEDPCPCPWFFTLPNGSCMIKVLCGVPD